MMGDEDLNTTRITVTRIMNIGDNSSPRHKSVGKFAQFLTHIVRKHIASRLRKKFRLPMG